MLDALRRLRIRHVRDAIFASPAPQAKDFNERYYGRIDAAARMGIRFNFIMGRPGNPSGSLPELVRVAAGRLRGATESLEGPNEFDLGAPPGWPGQLAAYQRELHRKIRAEPRLRGVPVVGPSIISDGEREVGDLTGALDLGNLHPYTGGEAPTSAHVERQVEEARPLSGARPVIATEAGFHNAMAATEGKPPLPEDVAAGYVLRTLLEHYAAGIRRTYLYELLDEKPDAANADPEQHFGLLRNDLTDKPAAVALRRLMDLLGDREPPRKLSPLRVELEGDRVRRLLLQRHDGRQLLMLWSETVRPATVGLRLSDRAKVQVYRPAREAAPRELSSAAGTRRIQVGVDPVAVLISGA